MNPREQRGIELAEAAKISRRGGDVWAVLSQNGGGRYWVRLNSDKPFCTCPDYEIRDQKCKHIFAVEHILQREANDKPKATRKWSWASYNAAQSEEKAKLLCCSPIFAAVFLSLSKPTAGRAYHSRIWSLRVRTRSTLASLLGALAPT
jgi:hypothetical protein